MRDIRSLCVPIRRPGDNHALPKLALHLRPVDNDKFESSISQPPSLERLRSPSSPAPPGRIAICRVAIVTVGIRSRAALFGGGWCSRKPWLVLLPYVRASTRGEVTCDVERLARARASQLGDQAAEVRSLDLLEAAGTVFCWITPGVREPCSANARTGMPSPKLTHCIVMISSTIPGSSRPALGALHLQRKFRAIEVVVVFSRMPIRTTVFLTNVLKLVQPHQTFTGVKSVGTANVLGASRRVNASGCCSACRKERRLTAVMLSTKMVLVAIKVFERAAHAFEMRLRVAGGRRERRIWATDTTCEVARGRPIIDTNSVDQEVLYGEITGLDIQEWRGSKPERA